VQRPEGGRLLRRRHQRRPQPVLRPARPARPAPAGRRGAGRELGPEEAVGVGLLLARELGEGLDRAAPRPQEGPGRGAGPRARARGREGRVLLRARERGADLLRRARAGRGAGEGEGGGGSAQPACARQTPNPPQRRDLCLPPSRPPALRGAPRSVSLGGDGGVGGAHSLKSWRTGWSGTSSRTTR
jgi:hypothetical protein